MVLCLASRSTPAHMARRGHGCRFLPAGLAHIRGWLSMRHLARRKGWKLVLCVLTGLVPMVCTYPGADATTCGQRLLKASVHDLSVPVCSSRRRFGRTAALFPTRGATLALGAVSCLGGSSVSTHRPGNCVLVPHGLRTRR